MNVLVVGGAGYIGSHMVRILERSEHTPVVLDNLCTGHAAAVKSSKLIVGDMIDQPFVEDILQTNRIDAVMHFAAHALVGESVAEPGKYYRNNVVATLSLLQAMRNQNVNRLVFSSTCAIYGAPEIVPMTEREKQAPVNPYGFTKLVCETAMRDYARAYGLGFAALRYFNAAGASPDGDIGEDHDPESHLIPIVLQVALGQRGQVTVFGDDWPTPDGTCIRDYIHVDDLGQAHLLALEQIRPGEAIEVNLGTGNGYSVQEVIECCRQVTGRPIPKVIGPRRAGDPAELVADSSKASELLQWTPNYPRLEAIVETAWNWHKHHPQGYQGSRGAL
jgi:UDP-glucose 4-epimerase